MPRARTTARDVIVAFRAAVSDLEAKAWPADGSEVSVVGEEWDYQMVVRVSDVALVIRRLARRLNRERKN